LVFVVLVRRECALVALFGQLADAGLGFLIGTQTDQLACRSRGEGPPYRLKEAIKDADGRNRFIHAKCS
jgi:hypothetical protein